MVYRLHDVLIRGSRPGLVSQLELTKNTLWFMHFSLWYKPNSKTKNSIYQTKGIIAQKYWWKSYINQPPNFHHKHKNWIHLYVNHKKDMGQYYYNQPHLHPYQISLNGHWFQVVFFVPSSALLIEFSIGVLFKDHYIGLPFSSITFQQSQTGMNTINVFWQFNTILEFWLTVRTWHLPL